MNALNIIVPGKRRVFAPGEMLRGQVIWELRMPRRRLELRLCWLTHSFGVVTVHPQRTLRFERPLSAETREFEIELPAGPYSYVGSISSLNWMLELVSISDKTSQRWEFDLSPEATPVVLGTPGA
jgi:hypothetical protein